jgi:Tfp pilus assembly protein PilV
MKQGRARGFTIIETMLAASLTSVVVATMALAYHYAAVRTSQALATSSVSNQVQSLMGEIDATISKASSVTIVTTGGNTGIRCTMPASLDTTLNAYTPATVTGGSPTWGKGKRVWFYTADASGAFTSPGTIVWRAERNDDLTPTAANADASFAYQGGTGGKVRYSLVDGLTWSYDSTNKYVTYTIKASTLTRAERSSPTAYTSETNSSRTLQVTKNVFLRNWRQ